MIKYGPYVVVKNLKTREFKEKNKKRWCSKCNENWESLFCPNCGSKISSKCTEKTVKRKPVFGVDFLKRATLWYLDSNQNILIPRKKWAGLISFNKGSCEFAVELNPTNEEDFIDEFLLFEQAFAKELKELRDNYELVEIKFGIANIDFY